MNRLAFILLIAGFVLCSPGRTADPATGAKPSLPRHPVALALDPANNILIIAERDGSCISLYNESENRLERYKVPGQASGTVVHGNSILTTIDRDSRGYLIEMSPVDGRILREMQIGQGARSPVIDHDRDIAYICNYFSNDISVIDLRSFCETARIPVPRMPSACALTPDGHQLFVANFLPDGRSDIPVVASKVTVIDTGKRQIVKNIQLENGSNALKDIAVSPDGLHVLVTQTLGRHQVPTTQLERGWVNTNALSVIGTSSLELKATVLLDEPDRGAAGPWGIGTTEDGQYLLVAHSGTNEISIIDYPGMIEKIETHPEPRNINYDLAFLDGLRRRVPLPGIGCRALSVGGNNVYISGYFSDSICIMDIESINPAGIREIQLNPNMLITPEHLGEQFFNDATICYQNWQSCSSCHPEGRMDGLNWDLLNDGMGNPKNTKSILYSHFTPPTNYTGCRPSAESSVRAGFKYIHFSGISEENARAVDAYLKSMTPEPSPWLEDGQLSEDALKGMQLFNGKAKCLDCHNGKYLTDMEMHEMKNAGPRDRQSSWDTPTLVENWRSGPYLHDGRAATLYDVVARENHGNAAELLEEDELLQLVEYMKTL